ncbi:MAG: tetratricopeptide repeat protein [Bacteroidales bacterium]|nr:tetratricopeptide repeat protein [Bacteroidales bacterium]
MNFNKMKILAAFLLTVISFTAFSQDINNAGELYNEGNQALKSNEFELAIQKYEAAMDMAEKLGEEGEMIVVNAQTQIPQLYYKIGVSDYKEKKIEKAIGEFEKAIEMGEKYNDPETVSRAKETIPKLYYSQGNDFYSSDKFEDALASFSKAAEMAPDYSRAFWGLGLVYNKMDETKKMKESFEKARELAKAEGDEKMEDKIIKTAKKYLQASGAKKLQAQDWSGALVCLDASLSFDPENADNYYYISLANNGLNNWDAAVEAANRGIELSADKNVEYKAKFYYELGNALKGKGDNSNACEAFGNAKYGSFVESAEYELTQVLKCN